MYFDEWISYWAKLRPDNIAVILRDGEVRYADFDAQINKVAARLQALGIRPNGRVAIHQPDEYVHWLLILALDRLGFSSMSIASPGIQRPILAAFKADYLLLAEDEKTTPAIAHLRIGRRWFEETVTMPAAAHPQRRQQPDEILRFFTSSGTTGVPKLMSVTRRQMRARIDNWRLGIAIGRQRRGCALLGLSTSAGHLWPLCYWSSGGSCILNAGFSLSLAEALRRTRPTQLILSVDTLLALVRGPAAALPPMPEMEVFVVGSPVPKALADEARRVLSPDLNVFYATTEASGVAVGSTALQQQHDGTAGFLFPGVEIEAVDDSDRPLPRGITGILRVRSEGMVTRYENESPADAGTSPLRNGWFYPGDLGSVSAEGVVVVTGRVTEVLNIGGNKFQPAAIEELALDCDGILDAAAFSVPDEHDIERAWIAVVRGSDYKEGEIAGRIRARWPLLGRLQIAVTKQIPRNHMGKVDRLKLREQARGWAATAATQSQGPRT